MYPPFLVLCGVPQDEWFCVALLQELTQAQPDLVVEVVSAGSNPRSHMAGEGNGRPGQRANS